MKICYEVTQANFSCGKQDAFRRNECEASVELFIGLYIKLRRVRINVSWFGKYDPFYFFTMQFFVPSQKITIPKHVKKEK